MSRDRLEFASAQICAVTANINRTKDAKVFEPTDFIPRLALDDAEETDELDEDQSEPLLDVQALSQSLEHMLGRKQEK